MITLSNGLKIHFKKTGSNIVFIKMNIQAGSMYDEAVNVPIGTSHFLEHMCFNGSEKYPQRSDLLGLVLNKAGRRSAWTSHFFQEHSVEIYKDNVDEAFEYLSQSIFYLRMEKNDFESEKSIILKECEKRYLDNRGVFTIKNVYPRLIKNNFIKNFPLGNKDSIEKITLADIKNFHENYFNPVNMQLFITGNIDESEAISLCEKYFARIKNKNISYLKTCIKEEKTPLDQEVKKRDTSLIKYNMSYLLDPLTISEYLPFLFLYQILCYDVDARLFQKLRTEKGLIYSIYPGILFNTDIFIFGINTETKLSDVAKVSKIILAEILEISESAVSKRELDIKKKKFLYSLYKDFDGTESTQNLEIKHFRQFGKIYSMKELEDIIENINMDDIKIAAEVLLKKSPLITVL